MKYSKILPIQNITNGMGRTHTYGDNTLSFFIKKFFINVYNGIIFFNLEASKLNTRRTYVK